MITMEERKEILKIRRAERERSKPVVSTFSVFCRNAKAVFFWVVMAIGVYGLPGMFEHFKNYEPPAPTHCQTTDPNCHVEMEIDADGKKSYIDVTPDCCGHEPHRSSNFGEATTGSWLLLIGGIILAIYVIHVVMILMVSFFGFFGTIWMLYLIPFVFFVYIMWPRI